MSVTLVSLQFNHDLESAVTDAMTIRRNRGTPVILPEWEATRCVRPEDSPAAYAMKETYGNQLTLRGKFRLEGGACKECHVQAVPGGAGRGAPNLPTGPVPATSHANVLGNIPPTSVTFGGDGQSDWIVLPLHGVSYWKSGVGVYDIAWDWYFRCAGDAQWQQFARSLHRIYVTIALPTLPWMQTSDLSDTRLPWTEALDYACTWAAGSLPLDDASKQVTGAVYALGPATVTYDCPGGGSTHYAYPKFNLTAFLDRLRGGPGNGVYVNCSDCATVLSTFANLLGCDWWQSRMGDEFELNPLLAIGSQQWQTACGWETFSYHEVAWAGACNEGDVISDACLQVNGSPDPTGPPYVPLMPVNMVFGATGSGLYRDRLATPVGRPNCNPEPASRQRRDLM